MIGRRAFLSGITAAGLAGTAGRAAASSGWGTEGYPVAANHDTYPFRRDNDRVQFVDADPESGFNYPYYLATPERFRSEPVPLMVEMNNAGKGQGVEDLEDPVRDQITRFELQGPWLSEELGVPHLIPVVPRPDGDPVDSTHETISLDRTTMLHDGTDIERLDLQLLRMADHARERALSDRETHERLIFYGNSSGGVVGERMAAMHPEEILAVAAGGLNGFVVLPFEELGGMTLNYPVGTADFEAILGKPYDPESHSEVNMFYFQGSDDEKNRLPMSDRGDPDVWNDQDVLEAARAVYGSDMVEDRFPRCHIAYRAAGIDAQFRVYQGMGHNPEPASHDLREFLRRSIEGEDVSGFGQRLEVPLDQKPAVSGWETGESGLSVELGVSVAYPPPAGLVSYQWAFGDGTTGTGLPVTHTYETPGDYEVTLAVETPSGQRVERTTEVRYEADPTPTEMATSTPTESRTETTGEGPGFGALATLAGAGTAAGYLASGSDSDAQ